MITYCTNIHPGETWDAVFGALQQHIPAVKSAVSPNAPFPIGLRLPNLAAVQLTAAENNRFQRWLEEQDCFVPTLNGFPYGSFHNYRIKENVYLPDWRSPERSAYTIRLADLLSTWLPKAITGSISTVPLGFKGAARKDDLPTILKQLEAVLSHLARIYEQSGEKILLALEPEPGCLLETTAEVCRFFNDFELPERLRRHLGLCYDCCHQAVEMEDPVASLAELRGAGIEIAKVQISSAIRIKDPAATLLQPFAEPCYLHQVVIRRQDGSITRYADLPSALTGHDRQSGDEWRCHFHVPIFQERFGDLGTTRSFIQLLLPVVPTGVLLEVETYTWDVLPKALRCESVTDSIIREISWLKEQLNAAHCDP
ncbi:hypothetical protein OR1_02294 [Geobacter sp. OR-1]|uniref:metabolite traffic protein EboE n=1 Tax=Geobacter sp. OR-1 TaxID=1266765 RepID=UPI0005424C4E|nr:metabolite traffic protein EboE [Geobacter sp. OR-1]GAM10009.1 hypothetical protein OR1_02294 [Geobacter sp. OR-1]